MKTKCTAQRVEFHPHFRRRVTGAFDGGTITSDGGALLLREVERRMGPFGSFARGSTRSGTNTANENCLGGSERPTILYYFEARLRPAGS